MSTQQMSATERAFDPMDLVSGEYFAANGYPHRQRTYLRKHAPVFRVEGPRSLLSRDPRQLRSIAATIPPMPSTGCRVLRWGQEMARSSSSAYASQATIHSWIMRLRAPTREQSAFSARPLDWRQGI